MWPPQPSAVLQSVPSNARTRRLYQYQWVSVFIPSPFISQSLPQFCCWRYRPTKASSFLSQKIDSVIFFFFRSSPISCTQSKYGAVLFFFCHAQFRRVVVWILVVRVTICDYSTRWVRLTPPMGSPGWGLNWGSVASIVGIICERFGVLCSQAGFSPHWANVYLECITFISIRCVSLCLCACESTPPVSKNSCDSGF